MLLKDLNFPFLLGHKNVVMAIGVDWGQTGCCGGYIDWPRTRKVADVSTWLG